MQTPHFSAALLLISVLPGYSQVLPVEPLPQVVAPVTERVQRQAELLQQQALQQTQHQHLLHQLAEKAALPDPLTILPKTLDVLSHSGQLGWREVEVELGFRAVEREWLLLLSAQEWQQLSARWPQLQQFVHTSTELQALGLLLLQLKLPAELDSATALSRQFNAELARFIGRNHLYQPQLSDTADGTAAALPTAMCEQPVTLGMVDTAVATGLPALATGQFRLLQQNFLPADITPTYSHGTAVASVLAARADGNPALLPQLTLYSASAFYASSDFLQSATLAHVLTALNWLAGQQVKVINMSLTGPDNPVLALTVAQLAQQQVVLVAAAGNGGPTAAALYPAAYPDVIAVTAVDQQLQLYRWANQGDYIDYAAVGVKVPVLSVSGAVTHQSGTSLAAPVVSAAVACLLAEVPELTLAQIKQQLTQRARDVGPPGKDSQFGFGLLSAPLKAQLQ
ncbi:S8 family serine peptidase [Rheinheimera oceanensis]|uniref:S8 family serine peptidase n=1 Tax=Rheinheimera oceanensis TaxID=2817449 RepID=UPI002040672F|nr:S8 family serine peptidase [Rheinheimera oceanensis]